MADGDTKLCIPLQHLQLGHPRRRDRGQQHHAAHPYRGLPLDSVNIPSRCDTHDNMLGGESLYHGQHRLTLAL